MRVRIQLALSAAGRAVAALLAKAERIAVSLRGAAKSISKFKECFGKPDPDSAAAASPGQPK
jgi:hypothetical protein